MGPNKNLFIKDIENIKNKNPEDMNIKEMGMLKQYEDEEWQKQFDYQYDYEDEEDDMPF